MIEAGDVRRLLASDVEDPTLVLVEGRAEVVPAAELAGTYQGAMVVTSRDELAGAHGDGALGQQELDELVTRLNTQVGTLGG